MAIRHLRSIAGDGRLVDVRYQSVDEKGRPYTVTATGAVQAGPQRVNLTAPQGDVSLSNGSWLLVHARQGVYLQHSGQLDLSGNATLYRWDEHAQLLRHAESARKFLGYHGVEAILHVEEATTVPSNVLLDHVRRLGAGLLVMGAFGQSAIQEFLIGSATRTIINSCPVPLFLHH